MKYHFRFFISIFVLLVSLCLFTACGQKQTTENNDIELAVSQKLEELDDGYDDETLKAMSVAIRTSLNNGETYSVTEKETSSKYKSLASDTNGETINVSSQISIYEPEKASEQWSKTIKKSDLLSFALKNNISLSNISKIEPVYENERLTKLVIAEKTFDFAELAKEFGLKSNKITNIENNQSSLTIYGEGYGFGEEFLIEDAVNLSLQGYNYTQILNKLYPSC